MSELAPEAQRLHEAIKQAEAKARELRAQGRKLIDSAVANLLAYQDTCEHNPVRHQGSLVGQQWITCSLCNRLLDRRRYHGPPLWTGRADVYHKGTGN